MLIATVGSVSCHIALQHFVASTSYLHFDELFVVVFTEVVHQLHGEWLPTCTSRALAWVLNGATDVVPQCLLTTGCTLKDCRPALILALFTTITAIPCCMLLMLHLI